MWEWLLQNVLGGSRHSKYSLPVLDKPAAPEQQQQQHGQQQQPEYCLRMAFKLTPTYSSQLQARVRWLNVLQAAQQPAGGSWTLDFDADDMTPRRLQQLAKIIDNTFLNGSFAAVCSHPSYVVQDTRLSPDEAGICDRKSCRQAVAGFEPATNSVIFYRPSWRRLQPSLRCPLQADGVYCTNKLAWLAHTIGHEMVHCIVHHACPEARSSYQAYQDDFGHGPVFLQLNKHIFGHHTARFKAGWGRLRPHLHVEPLSMHMNTTSTSTSTSSSTWLQQEQEQEQEQQEPQQWHEQQWQEDVGGGQAGTLLLQHLLAGSDQQLAAAAAVHSWSAGQATTQGHQELQRLRQWGGLLDEDGHHHHHQQQQQQAVLTAADILSLPEPQAQSRHRQKQHQHVAGRRGGSSSSSSSGGAGVGAGTHGGHDSDHHTATEAAAHGMRYAGSSRLAGIRSRLWGRHHRYHQPQQQQQPQQQAQEQKPQEQL